MANPQHSERYDVVFVGAGHNALVAACYLARAGRGVCLLDRAPVAGGWVRSEELTLPGFVHDTFSALHPSLVSGPVWGELGTDLSAHGLRYLNGPVATGSSLPDGRATVIPTDPADLTAELDRLGETGAWGQLMADMSPYLATIPPLLGMDLTSPEAGELLGRLRREGPGYPLAISALFDGSGLDIGARFGTEELRSAVLPWLLHLGIGPADPGGALWAALVPALLAGGNPTPEGGSGRLTDALCALLTAHGGVIHTGVEVDRVLVDGDRASGVVTTDGTAVWGRHVVASTTPDLLYGRLLRDVPVPDVVRGQAARYAYRRGCVQISLALSARPRFTDPRLDAGGALNLGRGIDGLVTSVRQAEGGLLPRHPSISWHEPTALDPTRAPEGRAVVRVQVLDAPLRPTGDAAGEIRAGGSWTAEVAEAFADRVIAEAGLHVKDLESLVLARHVLHPGDLARSNPNAGPGDHASGHNALGQTFTDRPISAHRGGYATAVPGLSLIGAATWPGPGITGVSGRTVARALLAEGRP
ncbi:MAG TPA: NAD(P)/FAD-dependent oxidoreductase [Pseudonocardia sp.]|jgi:phytoene dehydrogenase-like protein|nr:NAD(P)/FAD-dependent oxidoreductase [Pseudonocardia sp.]